MRQRVKPWTRLHGGILVPSMSGVGLVESGGGDGSFKHGDLVTITGSGFGPMPAFAFAGGANGVLENTTTGQIPNSGSNQVGDSAPAGFNWTRFTGSAGGSTVAFVDSTRGKVARYTVTGNSGESCQEYKFPSTVALGGKFMVKYCSRYHVQSVSANPAAQLKFTRVQAGTTAIQDTNNNMVFTYRWDSSNDNNYWFYLNSLGGTGTQVVWMGSPSTATLPAIDNTWSKVEYKITAPTAQGSADGRMFHRAIRAGAESVGSYFSRTNLNGNPNSNRYSAFTWQNWWGNGLTIGSGGVALDDHYISLGTFKCVELWDSLTPTSATRREIQEPTIWEDGSITVRLNRGGLADGAYYLVVLADSESDSVIGSREIVLTS